jgi:hypothetical protein
MQLVVWNSCGDKWDVLWNAYISPILNNTPREDVLGLVVEAGWAPWVTPGNVVLDEVYPLDSWATWYDKDKASASDFCSGVSKARMRRAFWVPWVGNIDAMRTNSRCSMGAVAIPKSRYISQGDRIRGTDPSLYYRPIFRIPVKTPSAGGGTTQLTVFLVHLVSGKPAVAQAQVTGLVNAMSRLVPEGTGAIVVGDFNINIQPVPFTLPPSWRLLRAGVATHAGTGASELDYGLLYDPRAAFSRASVTVLDQYQSGRNPSDHSVMQFSVPLS